MIKSISLAYRRPGMSAEEFRRYWKNVHAPLAERVIPGMRKYVQNYIVPGSGGEADGDGIVEMWWDNLESFKNFIAWVNSDAGRELREDGDRFLDMGKSKLWLAEECVIKELNDQPDD